MKISIIAAIGKNNEIGLNNQLLWKSESDLEHFKQLTLGKPIIMGRKTFESLPGILPGRPHYVVSSKPIYDNRVNRVHSIEDALLGTPSDEVFIIGGASIYEQALPLADELHISHMNWTGEADTFFPEIGDEWTDGGMPVYTRPDISHPFTDGGPSWTYRKYTRSKHA